MAQIHALVRHAVRFFVGRRWRLSTALVLAGLFPAGSRAVVSPAGLQPDSARARITIASGVRLRTAPQLTADEVARVPLGTVVTELERSANKDKVGGVESHWYRVAAPAGKEGWVFGGLLASFDPARKGPIYRWIAGERLKVAEAPFTDLADLVEFLTRAAVEADAVEDQAELELARALALRRAAAAIPFDQRDQSPYQQWVKSQGDSLVYSEPAGQWLVDSDQFWGLQKRYQSLPIAERIAWEGAQNSLPGECESDLPCLLSVTNLREGYYLRLYPGGAHAAEALGNISELLDSVTKDIRSRSGAYDVGKDRGGLRKELADLRATVLRTLSPKRAAVLRQLDEVMGHYR